MKKNANGGRFLIQGNVPGDVKDRFDAHVQAKKYNIGRIIEVMTELWLALPEDKQAILYSSSKPGTELVELVRSVVEDVMREGFQAGQDQTRKRKRREEDR